MNAKARKLLDGASELPRADRAELAAEILATIDGPPDADAEQAWAREIERRAARARSGESPGVHWSKVRAEARRRLRSAR